MLQVQMDVLEKLISELKDEIIRLDGNIDTFEESGVKEYK